jgi:hypothetical protein
MFFFLLVATDNLLTSSAPTSITNQVITTKSKTIVKGILKLRKQHAADYAGHSVSLPLSNKPTQAE